MTDDADYNLAGKFHGCVLGAAIGDALAFPHLHYSREFLRSTSSPLTTEFAEHHSSSYSTGQYSEHKYRPTFEGQEGFGGTIVTERDLESFEQFEDARVAVVGFGKSAVDITTFAATRAAQVDHVFRTPRWMMK